LSLAYKLINNSRDINTINLILMSPNSDFKSYSLAGYLSLPSMETIKAYSSAGHYPAEFGLISLSGEQLIKKLESYSCNQFTEKGYVCKRMLENIRRPIEEKAIFNTDKDVVYHEKVALLLTNKFGADINHNLNSILTILKRQRLVNDYSSNYNTFEDNLFIRLTKGNEFIDIFNNFVIFSLDEENSKTVDKLFKSFLYDSKVLAGYIDEITNMTIITSNVNEFKDENDMDSFDDAVMPFNPNVDTVFAGDSRTASYEDVNTSIMQIKSDTVMPTVSQLTELSVNDKPDCNTIKPIDIELKDASVGNYEPVTAKSDNKPVSTKILVNKKSTKKLKKKEVTE